MPDLAGQLGDHLSEAGLNRARVHVEVEWLIAQTDRGAFGSAPLSDEQKDALRAVVADFGQEAIDELAGLEATTRHDVKAVEYFVHPTHYDTTNTDRDLAGSGIACPRVPDYLPTLVRFFLEHREADVGAMV